MDSGGLGLKREGGNAASTWVIVGLFTMLALALRLPGASPRGLFFDDAWVALPARVPLGEATHMLVTAPGFTLLERCWILLDPSSNRWTILLSLAFGLALVPATYLLARLLRCGQLASLVAALGVAVCPAAIEYSTRVKEYEGAALASCVVLALAELAYRRPSRQRMLGLGLATFLALAFAGVVLPVIVGAWAGLLLRSWRAGRWRPVLLPGVATAVASIVILTYEARNAPPALHRFWVEGLRLVGSPYTARHLARTAEMTSAGLLHGLLGISLPIGAPHVTPLTRSLQLALLALAALTALLVVLAGWWLWRRWRARDEVPALGAFFALATAVTLWALGLVPLGTGRTDVVLLPSILVLAASIASSRASAWSRLPALARSALLTVLVLVLGTFGWHFRAWYPSQDLGGLMAKVGPRQQPGDLTVVSYRNTFTWAFEGLSPWRVDTNRDATTSGTVGYSVVLTGKHYLVGERNGLGLPGPPDPFALARAAQDAQAIWVVGITTAADNPSVVRVNPATAAPLDDGMGSRLSELGWQPKGPTLRAAGVWARRWVRVAGADHPTAPR